MVETCSCGEEKAENKENEEVARNVSRVSQFADVIARESVKMIINEISGMKLIK